MARGVGGKKSKETIRHLGEVPDRDQIAFYI
jgi:hypothetical protein